MKRNVTMVAITTAIMIMAIAVKSIFFQSISNIGNYYFLSIMTIAAILFIVHFSGLILEIRNKRKLQHAPSIEKEAVNRREYYRIAYPSSQAPELEIESDDAASGKSLTYAITDISESGLSFKGGFFNPGDLLMGEVRFKNGNHTRITGRVLRKHNDITCLILDCYIPAGMLIKEQRQLLADDRQDLSPPPRVPKALKRLKKAKLSSLSPKGICKKGPNR